MALKLNTAPTIDPVSLAEAKSHSRIDDIESLPETLAAQISIAPGAHGVATLYSFEDCE